MRQKPFSIFLCLALVLLASCGDKKNPSTGDVDLSPCDEAFAYNKKVDVASSKIPYMKTCGLSVDTVKAMNDVYSRDISLDQPFLDAIYDELEITDKLFQANNIPYTLLGGTLLGALRNGGVIPNDDDVDIAMDDKYEQKLLSIRDQFEKAGYEIVTHDWPGYKIYKKAYRADGKTFLTNGLDVFLMKRRTVKNVERMHYSTPNSFGHWPDESFTPEALNDLVRIPFGHLTVSSVKPEVAIAFLDVGYKNDWYTTAYKTADHVTGTAVNSAKVSLLPTEYYYLRHSSTSTSKQ